jgi:hypothetical protein
MAWIRCPFGCYFELPPLNWGVFTHFPTSSLTCECCHRSNWAMFYQEDNKSAAIAAVNGVVKPNKAWQQEIEISIKLRISRLMGNINWFGYDQEILVEQVYHKIAQMLINSELTSNFPTPKIWPILSSAGALKNMWAKGEDALGGYGKERNTGELKLFGALDKNVSKEPTGEGRPYYIALSPGSLQQGAAPFYGQSYVVYKSPIKARCTFTATDSLQMLKGSSETSILDVCSISTIGNILMRVSDRQLLYLVSLVNGGDTVSPNEFIEAQGWGRMDLKNDVEIIVISEVDLQRMETDKNPHPDLMPPHLIPMNIEQRRQEIIKLREILRIFCVEHGIILKFLPLDGKTMNSREKRPN